MTKYYALIQNNIFVRWVDLKKEYPGTSWPLNPAAEDLPQGVVQVTPLANPNPGGICTLNAEPHRENDQWVLGWTQQSEEGVEERNRSALAAVYRERRNDKLRETDWTELPSVRANKSAEWCQNYDTYRQQLRDLTDHPAWPGIDEVDWPLAPLQEPLRNL